MLPLQENLLHFGGGTSSGWDMEGGVEPKMFGNFWIKIKLKKVENNQFRLLSLIIIRL